SAAILSGASVDEVLARYDDLKTRLPMQHWRFRLALAQISAVRDISPQEVVGAVRAARSAHPLATVAFRRSLVVSSLLRGTQESSGLTPPFAATVGPERSLVPLIVTASFLVWALF